MYLRFEDWSQFIYVLEEKKITHGGSIIKIYASETHPFELYPRNNFAVYDIPHDPFQPNEVFDYGARGRYSGQDLEGYLQHLNLSNLGKKPQGRYIDLQTYLKHNFAKLLWN